MLPYGVARPQWVNSTACTEPSIYAFALSQGYKVSDWSKYFVHFSNLLFIFQVDGSVEVGDLLIGTFANQVIFWWVNVLAQFWKINNSFYVPCRDFSVISIYQWFNAKRWKSSALAMEVHLYCMIKPSISVINSISTKHDDGTPASEVTPVTIQRSRSWMIDSHPFRSMSMSPPPPPPPPLQFLR